MIKSVASNLETIARNGGATKIVSINPGDVVLSQWVRHKCLYGCPNYGKSFTCPPYVPEVEQNEAMIHSYTEALLVQFEGLTVQSLREGKDITSVLYEMERTAFVNGYERAFSYGAGWCSLCRECPAKNLAAPDLGSKKECLHPKEARPSMEAAGIDVYTTVRRLGIHLETVKNVTSEFSFFGLLLTV